ncbi:MAG: insulinase family protein [Bergeyella sp.]|nr:insulinase family protein [Bergeyella sp.]
MKKFLLGMSATVGLLGVHPGQKIKFEEYDLPNGLHVVLHQDKTVPVVTVGVMYHVGSKDEKAGRTGLAHFFEHLLFEGTQNIKRGEWSKIVSANGGYDNAYTTNDVTFYYESFPSNNEQLGLWMEAERMRSGKVDTLGVETQREVVKEEKRMRVDNQPYGKILESILENLFLKHPYRWAPIGSMEDLNAAKIEEFRDFYKKYYVPNNAVLVVAGNIDPKQTKKWIEAYFRSIPKGNNITKKFPKEEPITSKKEVVVYDKNIQLPAYLFNYRIPGKKERESYVLDMLATYLSNGKSSVLYKKLVDKYKRALEVETYSMIMEDYGIFSTFIIPMGTVSKQIIEKDFDTEIKKLQTELISEEDFKKLQNTYETDFVNKNSTLMGVATSLAINYTLVGDTDLINKETGIYKSITREELRNTAKKYLNPNQRIEINYLPEKK